MYTSCCVWLWEWSDLVYYETIKSFVSEKRVDGGVVGCDSEDRESGVGSGVNTTILFVTLQVVWFITIQKFLWSKN